MANFITVIVLAIILGAAIIYIVKEKKKGTKCIGCPAAGTCASRANGGCQGSCGCHSETE